MPEKKFDIKTLHGKKGIWKGKYKCTLYSIGYQNPSDSKYAVYVCQNYQDGSRCKDTFGHKYSFVYYISEYNAQDTLRIINVRLFANKKVFKI